MNWVLASLSGTAALSSMFALMYLLGGYGDENSVGVNGEREMLPLDNDFQGQPCGFRKDVCDNHSCMLSDEAGNCDLINLW